MLKVGLLGLGTVGQGVVEMLGERQEEISALLGKKVEIAKALVTDLSKEREINLDKELMTDDFNQILNDDSIDVIVEVTSSLEEAYGYMKSSLEKGKHVVSANKAALSKYFEELSSLAEEKGLALLYEASVAGGIPVLKPLKEELILNEIDQVQGILNGTCNYILTRMTEEGLDYGQVLKAAQDLGYAEADPAADVEGLDTLRKLRILATLALQGKVEEEDIILEGIERIKAVDIERIKALNSSFKLIGQADYSDGGFSALVMPAVVTKDSYFASVNQASNSVAFEGSNVGQLKFYGPGAGKLPTANAILTDLLDIGLDNYRKESPLADRSLENRNDQLVGKFYLRLESSDQELRNGLQDWVETFYDNQDSFALVTKPVKLNSIYRFLQEQGLEKKDYFIARFL